MEQPKKERSLRMLTLMMQRNKRYTVNDLARELEIDRRTVYRYISTFNEVGLVVLTDHRHVRLATNTLLYKELSDLLYFSREEAITLYNAIESIETDNTFRQNLKSKLASIYGTRLLSEKLIRLEKNNNTRRLMRAIEERRQVVLEKYLSPNSDSVKDRLVEAFALSEDKKHVWAYEIESKTNKVFKISRIQSVRNTEQIWLNSRFHQKGMTDAFRMINMDGNPKHIRMKMNKRAYSLMIEEYPLTEENISFCKECKQWIYEANVSNYLGIGRFVLGLADCIEIETPDFAKYISGFAEKYLGNNNLNKN